jgi:hypothetical protein
MNYNTTTTTTTAAATAAAAVWNNIIADAKKLECTQRKFEALCFTLCLLCIPYNYAYALELPSHAL